MMWIQHRAKRGDTLDKICKQYKNKDPEAVIRYHKNKRLSLALKKNIPFDKNEVVWVLNPSSKVFIVSDGKKQRVLEEKAYNETKKEVHRVMERVLEVQRINFQAAWGRHEAQREINEDQAFVYLFVEKRSGAKEPMPEYGKASAAYKKLTKAVKSRDYKGFKSCAIECDIAVSSYNNAVVTWVNKLTDRTGKMIKRCKTVRAACEFVTCAVIITACAPASLGAAVALNALTGAGTGLVFDGIDAIGREIADEEQMSGREIARRFLENAAYSAAGALVVGGTLKLAQPHLAKAVTNSSFLQRWINTHAQKAVSGPMIEAEKRIAMKKLSKSGGETMMNQMTKAMEKEAAENALAKFYARLTGGSALKTIRALDLTPDLFNWMKTQPAEMKTSDQGKIGKAAADYLLRQGIGDRILRGFLKENHATFRALLREELVKTAETQVQMAA